MTAILSFALLLVLIFASLETVEGADTPPASGTWTIDVDETVTHSGAIIDLMGDLHVWGTLELDNSTLWVWLDASSPRELVIHPGGELHLTNTAVASQDLGRAYVLQAEDGSLLHLDRSTIWRAGDRLTTDGRYSGFHLATDDATIRDTVFMECLVGLWVTSADVELADCDFVDCRYGAVVDTSGYLIIDRAYILRCTIGALSNASMMTVRDSLVTGCEEGILAYGGNLTVARTEVSNCSIVGIGAYSAEATILEVTIHDAEADGVVIHESRAWISSCDFRELDTDVKVIHSVASLVANHHQNTFDEAMWMYHATFHVRDVVTEDSYWGLRCWKSTGVCINLTTINATFGAYIERCEDVTL
ncbi:MAG: right-handed parallel beta-helix repeat-containing protein, partial [Thermoplasmata archaeon]|nr:right-handed parallel beta-helix repeat-containing protein [Thermoplasmata archaeon]